MFVIQLICMLCECSLLKYVTYCAGAVSKTKSSVSQNLYFPETKFLSFEQRNLQQIFGKLVRVHICQTSIIF